MCWDASLAAPHLQCSVSQIVFGWGAAYRIQKVSVYLSVGILCQLSCKVGGADLMWRVYLCWGTRNAGFRGELRGDQPRELGMSPRR